MFIITCHIIKATSFSNQYSRLAEDSSRTGLMEMQNQTMCAKQQCNSCISEAGTSRGEEEDIKRDGRLWLDWRNQGRTFSPVASLVFSNLLSIITRCANLRSQCECFALCDCRKWPAHPARARPHLASRPSPNLSSRPWSHCWVHTQILWASALQPI